PQLCSHARDRPLLLLLTVPRPPDQHRESADEVRGEERLGREAERLEATRDAASHGKEAHRGADQQERAPQAHGLVSPVPRLSVSGAAGYDPDGLATSTC